MYTHPHNAAQLNHDRHRAIRADIGAHRLARQLRELAKAARCAPATPHPPLRALRPAPPAAR